MSPEDFYHNFPRIFMKPLECPTNGRRVRNTAELSKKWYRPTLSHAALCVEKFMFGNNHNMMCNMYTEDYTRSSKVMRS